MAKVVSWSNGCRQKVTRRLMCGWCVRCYSEPEYVFVIMASQTKSIEGWAVQQSPLGTPFGLSPRSQTGSDTRCETSFFSGSWLLEGSGPVQMVLVKWSAWLCRCWTSDCTCLNCTCGISCDIETGFTGARVPFILLHFNRLTSGLSNSVV